MDRQTQINQVHEDMNEVFRALTGITVADDMSRRCRETAILRLVSLRRKLDDLGLRHANTGGGHDR